MAPPPTGGATNWGRAPFRRVRGIATAILVLLGFAAVGSIVDIATLSRRVDVARDFLRTGDEDRFNEDYVGTTVGSLLLGAASIALMVLSIIWLYRVVSNHRLLHRQTSWTPGFAIGGWFLPPALYVIPTLILRESWKASDPSVPPGSDAWKQSKESPLIYVWFLLYSVAPIVLGIAGASQVFQNIGGSAADLAETIVDTEGITIAQSIIAVLSAVAWGLVVRGLTARHAQLTGEATGR